MENRKCLIIGAAGGIGSALASMLRSDGWSLVLAGRTAKKLEDLGRELDAPAVTLDARDFGAVEAVFAEHEGITGAVNLAGTIPLKPAHLTSAEEFEEAVGQNLRTAFSLTRAAGKHMRNSGGSVVLMSTCAATIGLSNHEAISAAKAGVEGLMRAAAATYASSGVRFNAVAPGLVDTPLASRITGKEAALKASIAMHPLGRIGRPEEVASVIRFLLGTESSWTTGQVFGVDGGLARVKPA